MIRAIFILALLSACGDPPGLYVVGNETDLHDSAIYTHVILFEEAAIVEAAPLGESEHVSTFLKNHRLEVVLRDNYVYMDGREVMGACWYPNGDYHIEVYVPQGTPLHETSLTHELIHAYFDAIERRMGITEPHDPRFFGANSIEHRIRQRIQDQSGG
jgi:hypothetical protein